MLGKRDSDHTAKQTAPASGEALPLAERLAPGQTVGAMPKFPALGSWNWPATIVVTTEAPPPLAGAPQRAWRARRPPSGRRKCQLLLPRHGGETGYGRSGGGGNCGVDAAFWEPARELAARDRRVALTSAKGGGGIVAGRGELERAGSGEICSQRGCERFHDEGGVGLIDRREVSGANQITNTPRL